MKLVLNYIVIFSIYRSYVKGDYEAKCHEGGATEQNMAVYIRISSNSKYMWFHPNIVPSTTYDHAVKSCREMDMELAAITSLVDFKSIATFLRGLIPWYDATKKMHWISGSDETLEGNWVYNQNNKNLSFQQFYGWNPQDTSYKADKRADFMSLYNSEDTLNLKRYDFVMIEAESENSGIYWQTWICQFKSTSPCFKDSTEEKENRAIKDTYKKIGETKYRMFYIAKQQKSWYGAKDYCRSKSMKLLDLSVSRKEAQGIYKLLREWLLENELQAITNSFHLAGKNIKLFKGNNDIPWEWFDDRFLDQKQDPLLSKKLGRTRAFGKCLAVGTLFLNGTVFSLARTLCSLPRWVICYNGKSNEGNGKDHGNSTTTKQPRGRGTTEASTDSETTEPSTDSETTEKSTDLETTEESVTDEPYSKYK